MIETTKKIKTEKELLPLIEELRKSGKKIVTTNGAFDLLHVGHVDILEKSAALGDVLVVFVNSDDSVKKNKGPERPIVPLYQRMRLLASLQAVTFVCSFDEQLPLECLKRVAPAVHTKGGDYVLEDLPEKGVVEAGGGEVVIIEIVSDIEGKAATTKLIEKIKKI